jgi:DnaJ-class molecular chaperone
MTDIPDYDPMIHGQNCETCAGNGELITDWALYMSGADDERATADCGDCYGTGSRDFAEALERALPGDTP